MISKDDVLEKIWDEFQEEGWIEAGEIEEWLLQQPEKHNYISFKEWLIKTQLMFLGLTHDAKEIFYKSLKKKKNELQKLLNRFYIKILSPEKIFEKIKGDSSEIREL